MKNLKMSNQIKASLVKKYARYVGRESLPMNDGNYLLNLHHPKMNAGEIVTYTGKTISLLEMNKD